MTNVFGVYYERTIVPPLMVSGMCSGPAASGKLCIAIGSPSPAACCTNGLKRGNGKASGRISCAPWPASMHDGAACAGSGRQWTANRSLPLWTSKPRDVTRPTATSAAPRCTSWLTNIGRHWRSTSPASISMTSGRLTTCLLISVVVTRPTSEQHFCLDKGYDFAEVHTLVQKRSLSSTVLIADAAASHHRRLFLKQRSIPRDGESWNGRGAGWPNVAVSAPDGARKARIGWPLCSLLVRLSNFRLGSYLIWSTSCRVSRDISSQTGDRPFMANALGQVPHTVGGCRL